MLNAHLSLGSTTCSPPAQQSRGGSAAAVSHSSRRGPIAGSAKCMVATPGLIMAPFGLALSLRQGSAQCSSSPWLNYLLAASAAEPLRLRSSPFGPHQPSRPDRWPCKEHCCYAPPDHGTNGLFRHCGIRGTRHGHRILGPPAVRRVSCPARRDRSAGCTPVHLTGSLVCGMPISLYGLEGGKLPAIKHFQVSNEETRHPPAGSRAS